MSRVITLDFTGAPPAQGGFTDHIPPGRYRLRVESFKEEQSKAGNRMITGAFKVAGGDHTGANLNDRFVMDSSSKFPVQRLHACFLALALPVGEKRFQLDLDRLTGLQCDADIIDDEPFVNDKGIERINSKVSAYHLVPNAASNGNSARPAASAPAAVAAPAPVAASVATLEPEPEAEMMAPDAVPDLFSPGDAGTVASEIDKLFK